MTIEHDPNGPKPYSELIPNISVVFNSENEINFSELILQLIAEGFPLDNKMISYFHQDIKKYVYCGKDLNFSNKNILSKHLVSNSKHVNIK